MKKNRSFPFLFLGMFTTLLLAGAVIFFYFRAKYPTVSPEKSIPLYLEFMNKPHAVMAKETVGFIPYWLTDNIKYIKPELLSEVIFFSISADGDGNIIKVVGNQTNPGWRWLNSDVVKELIARTQISGGKFSLAVAMQENDNIEKFLNDKNAQQNLISQIIEVVRSNKLDGINVDFEYSGDLSDDSLRDKYTAFIKDLSSQLKASFPDVKVSVDLYPLAVRKPRLTNVPELAKYVDRLVVMSYDYYASSSSVSGPVAPMGGFAEDKYFFDIKTTYADYLNVVPKEKILMGIPYYTWDYPVEDEFTQKSPVPEQSDENGYTSILSYGRMRSNTDIKPENCTWDPLAQSNWCHYIDPETNKPRQVWLENNDSIRIKFDYAKENDLAGIAIWALGYDKDYPDLWDMIRAKFTTPSK